MSEELTPPHVQSVALRDPDAILLVNGALNHGVCRLPGAFTTPFHAFQVF